MIIVGMIKGIAITIGVLFAIGCILAAITIPWAIWQIRKEEEQEKLPFRCMITEELCIMPEEPCTECEIYKEKVNEIIDENGERNIQDNKAEGR